MNPRLIATLLIPTLVALAGCKSQNQQAAIRSTPNVVHAAPSVSPTDNLTALTAHGNADTNTLTPEAGDALNFINRRFVASNCAPNDGSNYVICTRNEVLSIAGDKLLMAEDFEEHHLNGSIENSHEVQTVSITDLEADSAIVNDADYEAATDTIEVLCKNKMTCVTPIETLADGRTKHPPNDDRLRVGDFSRRDANEVASCLKRLLAIQQGKSATGIVHEPTESEALAFLNTHYAPSITVGGITAVHRSLTVEGDELVEAEDLIQYGQQSGQLVVRVNLKDLDELMLPNDRGVALECKVYERDIPNCFSANTGQSSRDHVIMGVSNPEEFSKMLKRLIVLHSSFGAS